MTEIFGYTACRQLSQMFLAVFFFHSSEYVLAAAIHGRSKVNLGSLLISKAYVFAMMFSWLEYGVEIALFPGLKEYWWISNLGLVMVILGEIIRKLAIITAGIAFTHLIKVYHEEQHNLITHGVYSFFRHPSYTGFLIWSVGTQIMLCNPISTTGFAVVVWRFFAQRIPYEEFFLEAVFWVEVRGICFANSFWGSFCEVKILWCLDKQLNSFVALILLHEDRFRKVPVMLCCRYGTSLKLIIPVSLNLPLLH